MGMDAGAMEDLLDQRLVLLGKSEQAETMEGTWRISNNNNNHNNNNNNNNNNSSNRIYQQLYLPITVST